MAHVLDLLWYLQDGVLFLWLYVAGSCETESKVIPDLIAPEILVNYSSFDLEPSNWLVIL